MANTKKKGKKKTKNNLLKYDKCTTNLHTQDIVLCTFGETVSYFHSFNPLPKTAPRKNYH